VVGLARSRPGARHGASGTPRHGVLPWATVTRSSRAWRRRGEHGGSVATAGLEKKGPRSGLALTVATRACWGARVRAPWHAQARARGHVRVANATQRSTRRGGDGQRRNLTQKEKGEARRAARASTKAAAPAEISDPAWLEGRHHQRRRGGAVAFRLGSKAVAHRGEVSGILTWVASGRCAGVGDGARRCDEEGGGAGRGRRVARRRGS
jgi:hypothetical protein